MRTPANFKSNNKTSLLRIQHTNLLLHFHSVLCEKLRELKWKRDQEEKVEQETEWKYRDEIFGVLVPSSLVQRKKVASTV